MNLSTALFAAGCFWGVQAYFDEIAGVVSTEVGYSGGTLANPTYEQVCSQKTGHAETVKIEFDPAIVSYHDLLEHFFRMHDPTTPNQDGPNIGESYRSAIFYLDDRQRTQTHKVMVELTQKSKFKAPIITQVAPAGPFYSAEEYHQKYFQKTGRGACHIWPSQVAIYD